jgi:hypothetical protein
MINLALKAFKSSTCDPSSAFVTTTTTLDICQNHTEKAVHGGTVGNFKVVEFSANANNNKALSVGVIVGISIAALGFVVIVACVMWFVGLCGTSVALSKQDNDNAKPIDDRC